VAYSYLEAEDVKQALAYSTALAENEYHWCCGNPREISGRRKTRLPGSVVFSPLSGNTAQDVHEVTGPGASDHEVMQYAIDHEAVIITADTDFGA
jgi:Domain of unknown function (DUF5615)